MPRTEFGRERRIPQVLQQSPQGTVVSYDRVDAVRNGRDAVTAWETGRYDLILMDCQMPELDGYEATREIRSRESDGQHIPIVALTAHAMKDDDLKCKAAGMDDYITKPIDRGLLDGCLERYLRDDRF